MLLVEGRLDREAGLADDTELEPDVQIHGTQMARAVARMRRPTARAL